MSKPKLKVSVKASGSKNYVQANKKLTGNSITSNQNSKIGYLSEMKNRSTVNESLNTSKQTVNQTDAKKTKSKITKMSQSFLSQ